MTKRAWIVIAVIILVPVFVTLHFFIRWKRNNPVVADWKGDTSVVAYRDLELHEVIGSSAYRFRTGKFIGKIADRLTGPSLFRIEGDDSLELFAVADSSGRRIYTAGAPVPAGAFSGDVVTGVFAPSGSYSDDEVLCADVAMILADRSAPYRFDTDDLAKVHQYEIYVCWDGSCVSANCPGVIAGPTERGRWYFIPAAEDVPEEAATTAAESGEETAETTDAAETADEDDGKIAAYEIVSADAASLLRAFLTGTPLADARTTENSGE